MSLQQHTPFQIDHAGLPRARRGLRGLAPVSGLLADTPVLTRQGFCCADEIQAGDALVTREYGLQQVRKVETITARSRMVRFAPETLSDRKRYAPLRLPAHQLVNLRDWRATVLHGKPEAKAPAAALIDDAFVVDDGLQEITLTRLIFASAATLYAGGMEILSAHGFDDQLRPVFCSN